MTVPAFDEGQEFPQRGWLRKKFAVLLHLRHQLLEDVRHVRADFRQAVLSKLAVTPIAASFDRLRGTLHSSLE